MRYRVLATDYDGTLAHHGKVDAPTLAALERVRASGRKVVLVSGRELEDLCGTFDRLDLFDLAVLENGGLLYRPSDRTEKRLGEPPPPELVELLRQKGVDRVSVGRVVVATWEPYQAVVLESIRALGLEHQVIFNKGAVMILPAGVNKATGLEAALVELGLTREQAVGVGDAENDHAFLAHCALGVAVANALPSLQVRADWITPTDHGAGVIELVDRLLANDLAGLVRKPEPVPVDPAETPWEPAPPVAEAASSGPAAPPNS